MVEDYTKKGIKKMTIWDWQLIKISLMLFGIAIAVLFPVILTYFAWYWWFALVVIMSIPTLARIYERKAYKGKKNGTISTLFKKFKYNLNYSDWPFLKAAVVVFGIGIAATFPQLSVIEWYIWLLAGVIIMVIPNYFMYHYAPKQPTKHSMARKKYSRSSEPFRYVKEVTDEDNKSYKYQRNKKTSKKK